MLRILIFIEAVLSANASLPKSALETRVREPNGFEFKLDHYSNRLPYLVLIAHGVGCPMVEKNVPVVRELAHKYQSLAKFVFVNANPQDEDQDLKHFAEEFKVGLPIVKDPTQALFRLLNVTTTTTAVVLNTKTATVEYRGAISDEITYDGSREKPVHKYLDDALSALRRGGSVPTKTSLAYGCAITFAD